MAVVVELVPQGLSPGVLGDPSAVLPTHHVHPRPRTLGRFHGPQVVPPEALADALHELVEPLLADVVRDQLAVPDALAVQPAAQVHVVPGLLSLERRLQSAGDSGAGGALGAGGAGGTLSE